jgi:hypothetical protein
MRKLASFALVSTFLLGVIGCDGSGGAESGVPKNVDMTKNYSPDIPVGPITPKDMNKAKAKEKEAPKPAATP